MDNLKRHRYLLIIVAVALLLFWRWLLRGEVIFWGTPLFQFWPWQSLVKTAVWQGEWPLWNPLLGNGTPLLANLQSAVFYPPNWLYLFLPVEHGFTLSVVLHLMLAGLLMTLYGRQLELRPFAAVVMGITFMLSGYIVGRVQFVTMINGVAWYPLLLILVERMVRRRDTLTGLLLGIVLCVQLLAGHAQLWFYGLWLIGPYVVVRTWQQSRSWPMILLNVAQLGGATVLALLLSAVQVLPTAEFTLESPRDQGAETNFALTYSFWPWRFITLLAPTFFGHPAYGNYWGYANFWEDHAYVGILPLLLAIVATRTLIATRRDTERPTFLEAGWFFLGLIPISLLFALGWNTPIYLWVFENVPGFGYFQAPSRLLIWYTVAMTVLAGIGAQSFGAQRRNGWRRLMAAAVSLTIAGWIGQVLVADDRFTFFAATVLAGALLCIGIAILLIRPWGERRLLSDYGWQAFALLFLAADLLWAASLVIPLAPAEHFRPVPDTAQMIIEQATDTRLFVDDRYDYRTKFDRYYTFDDFGPTSAGHWRAFAANLLPNVSALSNIPSVNNDDPLLVGHWQRFVDAIERGEPQIKARLLRLSSAEYIIGLPDGFAEPFYAGDELGVQRLLDPLPNAYFVPAAYAVSSEAEALQRLTAADFDSSSEIVIIVKNDEGADVMVSDVGATAAEVTFADRSRFNTRSIVVDVPTPGYVVLTDTYFPGWVATVDGQPRPILQANVTFRAVAVAAGQHTIDFRYDPFSFRLGGWISVCTWAAVAVAVVSAIRRKVTS